MLSLSIPTTVCNPHQKCIIYRLIGKATNSAVAFCYFQIIFFFLSLYILAVYYYVASSNTYFIQQTYASRTVTVYFIIENGNIYTQLRLIQRYIKSKVSELCLLYVYMRIIPTQFRLIWQFIEIVSRRQREYIHIHI